MPTVLLRFQHLKAKRVVNNRPQLRNLIQNYGFPPGRYISPHVRAWDEAEVDRWLESRPLAEKPALPLRGAAAKASARKAAKAAPESDRQQV